MSRGQLKKPEGTDQCALGFRGKMKSLHCFCQSYHGGLLLLKVIPKYFKEYSRLILLMQYQKTSVSARNGSCNRVSLLQSSCCFPIRKNIRVTFGNENITGSFTLICLCQPFTDPILFPPSAFIGTQNSSTVMLCFPGHFSPSE